VTHLCYNYQNKFKIFV